MKNLNQFLGEFKSEFQPAARFRAYMFPPGKMLLDMLTQLPDLSGGLFADIASIGASAETKTTMPIVAQWLARGLLCEATRLPSRQIETTPLTMYGYTEHFPFNSEFLPIDCSFYMPLALGDNPLPRFMNYWQNYIQNGQNGPDGSREMGGMNFRFPKEYYGSMLLALYDRKNQPTIVYKFTNLYPKTVESGQIAWESANEFLKLSVSFVYSSWKVLSRTDPEVLALIAAGLAGQ